MKKVLDINTVYQCNQMLSGEALHSLVSVMDLSKSEEKLRNDLKIGFYSILLKEYGHEYYPYGRKKCDYSDGTVIFLAPGNCLDTEYNNEHICNEGMMLAFHPELIRNTSLGLHIHNYSFFSYNKEEALHISEREKKIFRQCLKPINEELHRSIDKHSQTLIVKSIELLLGYCTRFYERQFILRNEENKHLIKKTEQLINNFFTSPTIQIKGLPDSCHFANSLNLSAVYFTYLLKHETGQTVNEYVEAKRIEIAKKWLSETNRSVSQVANTLRYPSVEYFSRLFEKVTGIVPEKYFLTTGQKHT